MGDYVKAIEYHAQQLAIAKEVGDRAGEGQAHGSLGIIRWGAIPRPPSTTQDLAIAKEVGDRTGERAGRTGTSGVRVIRWGTFARPSSYMRRTWRL